MFTTIDLKCPQCGNNDHNKLRFVETVENWRRVVSVSPDKIVVDSISEGGDGYDDGRDQRWECRKCMTFWPVTEDAENQIDFI